MLSVLMNNKDIIAYDVLFFLKQNKRNQLWLAKKVSTKKKKYAQPEISRAINGRDQILLERIRRCLNLNMNHDSDNALATKRQGEDE